MEESKKKNPVIGYFKYYKERCYGNAENVTHAVLMALYTAFCIGSLIYFAILGGSHYRDCVIALAYIVVVPIFFFAEYGLRIRSPLPFTVFVLVFCVFCFLGASYNFYTTIPMLDDILHACWGILFTALGFCIIKSLVGEPKNTKQFVAYIIFGIGFCMIISVLWEVYEFTYDSLSHDFDMQEDTLIHHFHSFVLHVPYDHLHTVDIDGIAKTILYDKDGNVLLELDGYLDIGLYDTMWDLIWCLVTTVALCLILAVDRAFGGKIFPYIIPVYVGNAGKGESEKAEADAATKEQNPDAETENPPQTENYGEESQ